MGMLTRLKVRFGLWRNALFNRFLVFKDDKGDHWIVPPELEDRNIISREYNPPEVDFPDTEGCGFHKKEIQDDFQKEDDLE